MLSWRLVPATVVALGMAAGPPLSAQLPLDDWSERPDARAPSGLTEDVLLAPGSYEVRYRADVMHFDGVLVGTEEIPIEWVTTGFELDGHFFQWEMAPLTMTRQRHELEFRAGILDWLGASLRVPVHYTEGDFRTRDHDPGTASDFALGDVELHVLYGLHDVWPYRAHLTAGLSMPTGPVDRGDQLPIAPAEQRTLPYSMQPGDGTFALIPGAVLVSENAAGTVGLQATARIPVGENDRGWRRGQEVRGNVWMAYRFSEWVSGSLRLSGTRRSAVEGSDPTLDPWSTPMAHPALQAGTRVDLPVGLNLYFADGPLYGNRLFAEFVLPVYQDLDGPQLKARAGVSLGWAVAFGRPSP